MFGMMTVKEFRIYDGIIGGLVPIGEPNSAGRLSIPMAPIWRIGINTSSQSHEAAWEFIRMHIFNANLEAWVYGFPVIRNLFEEEINKEFLEGKILTHSYFGLIEDQEIPAFSEERADVLRLIMGIFDFIRKYQLGLLNNSAGMYNSLSF